MHAIRLNALQSLATLMVVIASLSQQAHGFITPLRPNAALQTRTKLNAWSSPTDFDVSSMFNTQQLPPLFPALPTELPNLDPTTSWYTVSNPTRGRTVYEE